MKSLSFAVVVLALMAACVTVNLNFNFPQKEVQDKLYEHEKDLWGTNKEGEPDKKNNAAAFDPQVLTLQGDEKKDAFDVKGPAIDKIRKDREARVPKLKEYFKNGWIGEGNDGNLNEREDHNLTGKDKVEFNRLRKGENDDREKFLKEVLRLNNWDDSQMEKLRGQWIIVCKRKCDEGWWIQTKKGTWKKKTKDDQKTLDSGKDVEE